MRENELQIWRAIDGSGRIAADRQKIRDFLERWRGAKICLNIKAYPAKSSQALRGYYYGYVVPEMQAALYNVGYDFTEEQTDNALRQLCPSMRVQYMNAETGQYEEALRSFTEMANGDIMEYIQFIQRKAAEYLGIIIEDPEKY